MRLMSTRLSASPEELVTKFRQLKTRSDVADLLDIPLKQLTYHLYVVKTPYVTFKVKKTSGGDREISSPATALKLIQRKLADVLNAVYEPRRPVHGFVPKKSVVSNAALHVGARFVFNIDLENFFPSINFGRVRGMFMAVPYKVDPVVATVLAQICCFLNVLPQGAPTSPVVSNMICGKLDSQLKKLAKRYNCLYSRYADDLTFSTRTSSFPKSVARPQMTETGSQIIVGGELEALITGNGFKVNQSKTRLRTKQRRQEVTGLTINVFPNVRRRYISQVRAMLHAWDHHGPDKAEEEFHARYDRKHRGNGKPPSFKRVVKGKIDYLGMVRGKDDSTYIRFLQRYAALEPEFKYSVLADARTNLDLIRGALWVLETLYDDEHGNAVVEQGTAFVLSGVGVVTCAHVIHGETEAFRAHDPNKRFKVELIKRNDDLDLAVISIAVHDSIHLQSGDPGQVKQLDSLTVLGYPNYNLGDNIFVHKAHVTGFRLKGGVRRILVSSGIIKGNSGGPVLNEKNRVIGVAVTGVGDDSDAGQTEAHGVIPIDALNHLG